jgi:2-polyprenyl-3-methyl-5-hydroxy-6-metoxy-1,4-benzoquinol methylase
VGTHDWNKFLQPSEVEDMLERVNMNTRLVSGMLYLPGMYSNQNICG